MDTLLLNMSFEPLDLCNWKKTMKLVLTEKVDIVETNGRKINGKYDLPSVIRLKRYIRLPYKSIPLTKNNILYRDNFRCQYCGSKEDLTIDHIVPKSKGGTHTWVNVVTACIKCNGKKDSKSLNQTNLKLIKKPIEPRNIKEYRLLKRLKRKTLKKEWSIYLGN